jgi:hypothetical protein
MCNQWDDEQQRVAFEMSGFPEPNFSMCEDCGGKVHVGDWPSCPDKRFGGHERMSRYQPFVAFWDPHIAPHAKGTKGTLITSLPQWERVMKENGNKYIPTANDRDRGPGPFRGSTEGMDRHFNEAVREYHGGMMVRDDNGRVTAIGNLLRDDD